MGMGIMVPILTPDDVFLPCLSGVNELPEAV